MKISGFTFVRDGVRLGYPFEASVQSLKSLADEVVVNVGVSSDTTLDRVRALDDGRLVVFESRWDESLRRGGRVLAQQTDLALARCSGDWCVYLQADEVLHEDDRAAIRAAMAVAESRPDVDGLLFSYLHFYGSYHTLGVSRRWYRHEVRAFKRGRGVFSWRDAQGFRRADAAGVDRPRKLRVLDSGARIFHYGWVRRPEQMLEKARRFERLYHSDAEVERALADHVDGTRYRYEVDEKVQPFAGAHPAAMVPWIRAADWPFEPQRRWLRRGHLREDFLDLVEIATGRRFFEYRNYIKVG